MLLKEKEIYGKIAAEKSNEINCLNNKIKHDKLTYHLKSENRTPIIFNGFKCPIGLIRKKKDGFVDLEKAKENQEKFKSNLNETIRGTTGSINQKGRKCNK